MSKLSLRYFLQWLVLTESRRGFIDVALAIGVAALVSLWMMHFARVENEEKVALDAARASSRNLATIIATNLDEVLGRSFFYARAGKDLLQKGEGRKSYLNPQEVDDTAYLRAALFTFDGRLIYSSADRNTEPELQPLLLQAREDSPKHVYAALIGRPMAGVREAWRLPILVPIRSGEGIDGYYGAIIDLGYFLARYRRVELGQGGNIKLAHKDGTMLATLENGSLSYKLDESLTPQPLLVTATASSLTTAYQLDRFPIIVAVSYDLGLIAQTLQDQHDMYGVRSIAFSLLIILITAGTVLGLRRQQRLYSAMAGSEQEKRDLIALLEEEKTRALGLASNDYLTGLSNRRCFAELAVKELKRARRSRNLYCLLFLDLDRFKSINDELGHAIGDLLLKAVAVRLTESLREYDMVARLGGDEFAVLLSEMHSEEDVARVAAKLAEEVSRPYLLNEQVVETSPSIGIALYPRDGQDVDQLLMHADQAMYAAKKKGRGQFNFYDASLNELALRESELTSRFRTAIASSEFCLHYQPKYDLGSLQVVGLEALIRWKHPEYGLIFPGDFIVLAEASDHIIPLGRWVIDAACAQIAAWRAAGIPDMPIAINVSPCQLRDKDLPAYLGHALARHCLPARSIEIEITENSLITDTETALVNLQQIADQGVRIFLDDFGTGFSSLSRLKQLPISAVKIDRSFVRDLRNDTSDAVIVASTITLAHSLGLIVVAEGVESKDQLVHLKAAGCDQGQGFFMQRPVDPQAIELLLKQPQQLFARTINEQGM